MKELMCLKILALLLLFSISQAYNPFEGGFTRNKCEKGRSLTGCSSQTLLEAYKNTNLSKSDKNINKAETYVMLWTRKNKNNPEYLDECGGTLPKNTYFNKAWKVVIIVHGFLESVCQVAWMREMKDQLLFRDNYNVILVDYGWGNQLDYYDSVRNGEVVAKQIAFMIKNIVDKTGIETKQIHLIGHSLGSHVSGNAGHYTEELVGTKVRRITALDPAGPGFQNTSDAHMLDRSDAIFVDIIHTNAGSCMPLTFGHPGPLGHVDFYPNGGSKQSSCIPYILPTFLKGDISYGAGSLLMPMCYHKQSVQYFKVSINSCKCQLLAVNCDSYEDFSAGKCKSCGSDGSKCAVMGMEVEDYPWKEGSYFLDTTLFCPYCDNKKIKREGFPLLPPGKPKPKCFTKKISIIPNIG